ncbi:MAG: hypothetical protein JNK67_20490 [Alphaproteobacteria bacterium]|nr:hypothetical protein [Alphaproteobacteria bacterium]
MARTEAPLPQRIVIVGTTGAGKSHLARRIGARLGYPIVELDELHWLPGWRKRPEREFHDAVTRATEGPAWIVVGNYRATWPLTWPRAELVVWLDGGFLPLFSRLLRRSFRRAWTGAVVCNGNVETWRHLVGRDSILVWFIRTFAANRRRYGAILRDPGPWRGPRFVRLRSDREVEALLDGLTRRSAA